MPPKKVNFPEFRRMEAKVTALEGEMSEMKSALLEVQDAVRASHENLMAMFEKCLARSLSEGEQSANNGGKKKTDPQPSSSQTDPAGSGFQNLSNAALTEFRQSIKKVELPSFTGDDPAGWISRAEVYFRVQGTLPELKVNLAQLCMEGATIHFFNSLISEEEELSWERLKEALLARYGGCGEGDVYEQLTGLKQSGTVDDYITAFEYLIAQIPRMPDKQFLGYFLHGLKTEIRGRVRSFVAMGDMSRSKLLQVTRAVEKEIIGENGSHNYRGPKMGNGSNRPGTHGTGRSNSDWVLVKGKDGGPSGSNTAQRQNSIGPGGDRPAHNDRGRPGPRDRGFQHLTYQELMDRKQKGQCFRCKGRFHPTHQCPEKHLRILIVDDDYVAENDAQILAVEVEDADEEEDGEMSLLHLDHMANHTPQTIRFQGEIQGVPVLVLVDSGATHNFISQKLVSKMDWVVERNSHMRIKLGDGFVTMTQGVCRGVELKVGGFGIHADMHLFELGGIDVVLGVEWLKTLGDTIMNWKKQVMSFWSNKEWVTLQGLGDTNNPMVSLQSILSKTGQWKEKLLWSVEKQESNEQWSHLSNTQRASVDQLLQEYSLVFL
jgi:hypothetical protein